MLVSFTLPSDPMACTSDDALGFPNSSYEGGLLYILSGKSMTAVKPELPLTVVEALEQQEFQEMMYRDRFLPRKGAGAHKNALFCGLLAAAEGFVKMRILTGQKMVDSYLTQTANVSIPLSGRARHRAKCHADSLRRKSSSPARS